MTTDEPDTLATLRAEVAELRAARERLVLAADDDRRALERELHGGVQQHLTALAVRIQLAQSALESDPAGARELLDEIARDVQDAVDEAARLAQRIHAPLLEVGLAAALRAAAVGAGVPASVDVSGGSSHPPEILHTVYACWLGALSHAGDRPPEITVRETEAALTFELARTAPPDAWIDALRDRVEALGGTLAVRAEPDAGSRISGSLPLAR